MSERAGKAKEVVGRVTGDREVEARGRVEQEEDEVRQEHNEYKPGQA